MDYYVNPAVKLYVAAENILQIRFPDSRHVTIECPASKLAIELDQIPASSGEAWKSKFSQLSSELETDYVSELFETLCEICVLIPEEFKSNSMGRAIHMHEHLVTRGAKGSFAVPTFESISITGEGVLADVVSEVLENLSIKVNSNDAGFKLVVADRPDLPGLRKFYAEIGGAQFKACIWLDDGSLRLGPLHVHNESSCLECFVARCEATAHFYEEAVAFHSVSYRSPNEKLPGRMERNLALFCVERYLNLIRLGQFDQIVPGQVESWSLLTGDKELLPILRNPYCGECVPASVNPSRAVRDII